MDTGGWLPIVRYEVGEKSELKPGAAINIAAATKKRNFLCGSYQCRPQRSCAVISCSSRGCLQLCLAAGVMLLVTSAYVSPDTSDAIDASGAQSHPKPSLQPDRGRPAAVTA
jgi:hypothetical protein